MEVFALKFKKKFCIKNFLEECDYQRYNQKNYTVGSPTPDFVIFRIQINFCTIEMNLRH